MIKQPDFQSLRNKCYAATNENLVGVHPNILNELYHAGPGVSKSSLDLVEKSINHFLNAEKVRKETPAMLLGTCVHSALLEPHLWAMMFIRGPEDDKRSAAWKVAEAQAVLDGKVLVPPDIYDSVQDIVEAAMSHPVVAEIMGTKEKKIENTFYTPDPNTGILLKCRPDIWIPDANLLVDLKTTKCAAADGPNSFAKSAGMFNYDKQHAFYSDVVRRVSGSFHDFLFIAVENEAPYNCAIFELAQEDVENGRSQYINDLTKLDRFLRAADTEKIPTGYGYDVEIISIPKFMRRSNG